MVLRKVITIKNVGRFQNYAALGDVTLKRYNLIFAENGRGKTTLCAILRSLQSGDPSCVNGRMTLGCQDVPQVTILTNAGPTEFLGGRWDATVPNITIFDSTFVSENVYSGDAVDLNNRRNLYRVIIGKDGVDLAHQVDQLDADIRAKTSEIREKRADVQSHAPSGMSAEEFIALPNDSDIESKITDKERELQSAREAKQIQSRASLSALTISDVPDDLLPLLTTTIEGLAADAGRRVSEQLATHQMHARGEAWLSEGRQKSCDRQREPGDCTDSVRPTASRKIAPW